MIKKMNDPFFFVSILFKFSINIFKREFIGFTRKGTKNKICAADLLLIGTTATNVKV